MDAQPSQCSIFVRRPDHTLHIRRIWRDSSVEQALSVGVGLPSPAIFMLHGAVENGRIFYTESGRGLGPYLARHGYDVYIGDLRGRGESRPKIRRGDRHGQSESIRLELPAMLDHIAERRGGLAPEIWIGHSWGGVLLSSLMARYPDRKERLAGAIYFGSKRRVTALNFTRLWMIELLWKRLAVATARGVGFLPAKTLRLGSDNETITSLCDSVRWVNANAPWVDSHDGFDYGAALRRQGTPPIWYLAAIDDPCLGNQKDVQLLMSESGHSDARFTLLGRHGGFARDYDHISMLTAKEADRDHFPLVARWIDGCLAARQDAVNSETSR
jgi:pimeloyl-ACP methyl ester carboxylesterase